MQTVQGAATPCAGCGKPIPPRTGRGVPRRYCTNACRQASHRRRLAGEEALAPEAPRGPWTEDGLEAFVQQLMTEEAA